MTVIIGMVLLVLVATTAAVSVGGMRKSSTDANWSAAMAAAYAGVEDYQSRLSNDNTYIRYGNPAAPYTIEMGSTKSVVMPPTDNPAFGVGETGPWQHVAGSSGSASYRYEVDNSDYSASGAIRIRATGRVGDSIRSLAVNVKQQGFIDFLYFTDYEMTDPIQVKGSKCAPQYAWESSSNKHPTECQSIDFAKADEINGPAHSNDTMSACGSTFNGQLTTASTRKPLVKTASGCDAPIFAVTGFPKTTKTLPMPQTNQDLKKEYRTDLTLTTVPRPGCLYTGPTVITFNSGGTMTVKSPFTKMTRIGNAAATVGSKPAECGSVGTGANQLGSATGATIAVIEQNLIYVQDIPTGSTDVNRHVGSSPANFTCLDKTEQWRIGSASSPTAVFPRANESVPYASPPHYGCAKGDVYVSGTVHGQVTVAADSYVYITGDLLRQDADEDILGLIGLNAIWVWNPVNSSGNNLLPAGNRTIEAAILSVAHTFMVQNYNRGSKIGDLIVTGAIAQKYRGTVATTSTDSKKTIVTGYKKDYNYDDRFRHLAPPKFLSPVSTTYGVSELVEVRKGFDADGDEP